MGEKGKRTPGDGFERRTCILVDNNFFFVKRNKTIREKNMSGRREES